MGYRWNVLTGNLDIVTPGIQGANATTYFSYTDPIVSLYINGSVVSTWTGIAVKGMAGQPIGLLLALTHPN